MRQRRISASRHLRSRARRTLRRHRHRNDRERHLSDRRLTRNYSGALHHHADGGRDTITGKLIDSGVGAYWQAPLASVSGSADRYRRHRHLCRRHQGHFPITSPAGSSSGLPAVSRSRTSPVPARSPPAERRCRRSAGAHHQRRAGCGQQHSEHRAGQHLHRQGHATFRPAGYTPFAPPRPTASSGVKVTFTPVGRRRRHRRVSGLPLQSGRREPDRVHPALHGRRRQLQRDRHQRHGQRAGCRAGGGQQDRPVHAGFQRQRPGFGSELHFGFDRRI